MMTSLDRSLRTIAIRRAAFTMVGMCSDYQITVCAVAARIIAMAVFSIDDLSDNDLDSLWLYMDKEVRRTQQT